MVAATAGVQQVGTEKKAWQTTKRAEGVSLASPEVDRKERTDGPESRLPKAPVGSVTIKNK
jgi:hypothetical protein